MTMIPPTLVATAVKSRISEEFWIYEMAENPADTVFPGPLPSYYQRALNNGLGDNSKQWARRMLEEKRFAVWKRTVPHNVKLDDKMKMLSLYRSEREAYAHITSLMGAADRKAAVKEIVFAEGEPEGVKAPVMPLGQQLVELIAEVQGANTPAQRVATFYRLDEFEPQLTLLLHLYEGLRREFHGSLD